MACNEGDSRGNITDRSHKAHLCQRNSTYTVHYNVIRAITQSQPCKTLVKPLYTVERAEDRNIYTI